MIMGMRMKLRIAINFNYDLNKFKNNIYIFFELWNYTVINILICILKFNL